MKHTQTVFEHCVHMDCVYRSNRIAGGSCDYILVEGHSRGCKISECDKYVAKTDKHLRIKMNKLYDLIRLVEDYDDFYDDYKDKLL